MQAGDVCLRFAQCVAYPPPFSHLDDDFNRLLACFVPQVFVCDDLKPPVDVEDVAEAFVHECRRKQ